MNPFELIIKALSDLDRDIPWLIEKLNLRLEKKLTPQSVGHWSIRGVPKKLYYDIEDVLGKHRGWIIGDPEPAKDEHQKLSEMAMMIGYSFDKIPAREYELRINTFNLVTDVIRREIATHLATH